MRLLSPKIHGILDYAASVAFALAPLVFMIDEHVVAVAACYVVSLSLLSVAALTRYPLGVVRVIPFTVHGAVEFVGAPLLMALPWIAGFAGEPGPRNFFLVSGGVLFALWLVTDYRAADLPQADDRDVVPAPPATTHA